MREIDFLPPWYARLQERRRSLRLLVWCALIVVCGLISALGMARQNEARAQITLDSLKGQAQQANLELDQMQRLESLQKKWRRQAEVVERLGNHVESSRLINALVKAMPPGIALTELNIDGEEIQVAMTSVARAALKDPGNPPLERRLRVRLLGYAPTDVDLATFMTDLNTVPFFDRVAPTFVRDKLEGGHVLREFELTFTITLTSPGGV